MSESTAVQVALKSAFVSMAELNEAAGNDVKSMMMEILAKKGGGVPPAVVAAAATTPMGSLGPQTIQERNLANVSPAAAAINYGDLASKIKSKTNIDISILQLGAAARSGNEQAIGLLTALSQDPAIEAATKKKIAPYLAKKGGATRSRRHRGKTRRQK